MKLTRFLSQKLRYVALQRIVIACSVSLIILFAFSIAHRMAAASIWANGVGRESSVTLSSGAKSQIECATTLGDDSIVNPNDLFNLNNCSLFEDSGPTPAPTCTPLTENFDDITTLVSAGWRLDNRSQPIGTQQNWFQGQVNLFPAQSGPADSYISAHWLNGAGTATISNWLLTPPVTLQNGGTLTFYSRTVDIPEYPDRLQVRMSTSGSSTFLGSTATDVGDFTSLLLDINPTYLISGYPNTWTQFSATISGVPLPTTGRLAFRYFVENGGPNGVNSDHIGIDSVVYSVDCQVPTPTATATASATPTATPFIASISPAAPIASVGNQNVTVLGANFLPGLTVRVTFPNGGTATLSGSQIGNITSGSFVMAIDFNGIGGIYSIQVVGPGNIQSNVFSFFVQHVTPTINSISPSSPIATFGDQSVIVTGNNFLPGLIVKVTFPNGQTSNLSGSQITSVTPQSFVMLINFNHVPGVYTIRVKNPGGTESNSFSFVVAPQALQRAPFDYDGDGRTDISVFRPSNGTWYVAPSRGRSYHIQFGLSDDIIAPADYDADGRTDIGIYRSGLWCVLRTSDAEVSYTFFGLGADIPIPADQDGDGKADITVFRPSEGTRYRRNSSNRATSGVQFGLDGDVPTLGDFDGDGLVDTGVYRPSNSTWYRINSSNGTFDAVQFGITGDLIVPMDFNGDSRTDIAVFRPSTGVWYTVDSTYPFGRMGDIAVPGDYDGDGKGDVAVFRPETGVWYISPSGSGRLISVQFGTNGDRPTPSAYGN